MRVFGCCADGSIDGTAIAMAKWEDQCWSARSEVWSRIAR